METVRRYRSEGRARFYRRHSLLTWLFSALIAVLILSILFLLWFKPLRVADASMEPLLYQGEAVLADRLGKFVKRPGRGDVVLFTDPQGNMLLKRIIALPGERVEIVAGQVYIDSRLLDESAYSARQFPEDMEPVTVPQGCVFLMGDNRAYVRDSRSEDIGCVAFEALDGVLRFRIFPAGKVTFYY